MKEDVKLIFALLIVIGLQFFMWPIKDIYLSFSSGFMWGVLIGLFVLPAFKSKGNKWKK